MTDKDKLAIELYRDVAQPATRAVGDALGNAVRFVLSPANLVTRTGEEAMEYARERVTEKLLRRGAKADEIQTPPAEIAAPVVGMLQSATLSEPLQEMFLELLTKASHTHSAAAHPAFVRVIEQLTASEAVLLSDVARAYDPSRSGVGMVELRKTESIPFGSYSVIDSLITTLGLDLLAPVPRESIDNFIRLGLVAVEIEKSYTDDKTYEEVERLECIALAHRTNPGVLTVKRCTLEFTHFGALFLTAVTDPATRHKFDEP